MNKFFMCSPDVKCTLFKSFCSTMWYNCTVRDCYEEIENSFLQTFLYLNLPPTITTRRCINYVHHACTCI